MAEFKEILRIYREIGDRDGEIFALTDLGWGFELVGEYAAAHTCTLEVKRISHEIGNHKQELNALINLSSSAVQMGDLAAGIKYAEDAIRQLDKYPSLFWKAAAFTITGDAYFALNQLPAASQAYGQAYELWQEIKLPEFAGDALAGLARTALAAGDLPVAEAYTDQILAYLDSGGTFEGSDSGPMRIYLTCIQCLQAMGDSRAASLLELAYTKLIERASRNSDENIRRSFLENVPWHREIIALWESSRSGIV
jgi:tetratricopeptide (TPR) repeat protein